MRKGLEDAATVTMMVCALVLVGLAVRRQLSTRPAPVLPARHFANWAHLAEGGHRRGTANTPVVIVEFADYQCPSCERARFSLDSLLRQRPSDVSLVYRHYPLKLSHRYSEEAANAAECAADQGRFNEFSKALFDSQAEIGQRTWAAFALRAGVADTTRFDRCVERRDFAKRVDADADAADEVGLVGTPTLVINGEVYDGSRSLRDLNHDIDIAMSRLAQSSGKP